jgi:hypothetical protein
MIIINCVCALTFERSYFSLVMISFKIVKIISHPLKSEIRISHDP